MKKKVIKIAAWTGSILLLLLVVLVVHIYMVTRPRQYDNNNLQLSRIDFKQPVSADEAAKIRHFVAAMPGVDNAMFNQHDQTLVYGFNTGLQNSANVYKQLMAFGHYSAKAFVPDATQLASGCPMGKGNDGFVYKLSASISRLF